MCTGDTLVLWVLPLSFHLSACLLLHTPSCLVLLRSTPAPPLQSSPPDSHQFITTQISSSTPSLQPLLDRLCVHLVVFALGLFYFFHLQPFSPLTRLNPCFLPARFDQIARPPASQPASLNFSNLKSTAVCSPLSVLCSLPGHIPPAKSPPLPHFLKTSFLVNSSVCSFLTKKKLKWVNVQNE